MTEKRLYTFILEYNGGTYIGQASGRSPASALSQWESAISEKELADWKLTPEQLSEILKSEKPTPISGCIGVWCVTGSTERGLALINIIATQSA